MPFASGRVTFMRFSVEGDAPAAADDTTLATLKENAFQEGSVGAPDEVESGWVTAEHMLDTEFDYEKVAYGPGATLLFFALRIDTHKVPSDLKHAYKKINELALAAENPSGRVSRSQRRDAADTAGRQLHEDLAAGKFRRSKSVPILWDLARREVYCGAAGNSVMEQLTSQFDHSFGVKLTPITAGSLAGRLIRETGKTRDYEDLHPSAFTIRPAGGPTEEPDAPAPGVVRSDPSIPSVPWTQASTDMKDFLGNEFLIWLWHRLETQEGVVEAPKPVGEIAVVIDKALDMDCAWGVLGKQTLRADGPTRLVEAGDALATGKWPRKAGLILANAGVEGTQHELALQADRWVVSAASIPESAEAQTPRDFLEHRLESIRALAQTLDAMYGVFVQARVGSGWATQRKTIREWVQKRRKA
ncbi:MAG: hypothetical protein K8S99_12455 [Planctomycetes bacterium]|nr:hypothetical protein [Planctomycetota bacterium]